MRKYILDRYGKRYQLIIHEDSNNFFSAELKRKGEWIGKIEARFNLPDIMVIEDIEIRNDFNRQESFIKFKIQPSKMKCYRHKHLGIKLLNLAIGNGKEKNVKQICGSIVQKDINKTPNLVNFYKKSGFKEVQRYPDCLANAVVYVCLDLPRS